MSQPIQEPTIGLGEDIEAFGYKQELRRGLQLHDVVLYGVLFMVLIAPQSIWGSLQVDSGGLTPLVYIIGFVAISFTALSYAAMSSKFPIAGSVYSYVQRAINPHVGFMSGWLILLDYILVPSLLLVMVANWGTTLVPGSPWWLWVVVFIAFNTFVNVRGITMSKGVDWIIFAVEILALIVFIGSVGTLGYLFYTYWQGQNEYEEIASRVVEVPEDGHVANLADLVVDWDALREINPDIVAWVYMPGTIINYPVAHKDGDSEYYLHHNFSLGEGSFGAEFGSIMLSGENAGDFSDEVNILYGHHMRNGSMFALFAEFRDSAIFDEHRTIYLLTPEGNYRLQTFAVEHVPMTHSSIATPNYPTDEEFTAFKDWLVEESVVTPDPDTTDTLANATKLFGFCTCDGADNTWRYITFADVAEFVPIDYVGTGTYQGDTAVEDGAADEIAADAQERAEG